VLDDRLIDPAKVHDPRQATDVYLLALAVGHGGRFVTFDKALSRGAVRRAEDRHVVVI